MASLSKYSLMFNFYIIYILVTNSVDSKGPLQEPFRISKYGLIQAKLYVVHTQSSLHVDGTFADWSTFVHLPNFLQAEPPFE